MATKEAIAIKREKSTDRIQKDVARLVELFSLDGQRFNLEPFDRDPDLKHAMQLEGFADFLENLADIARKDKKEAAKQNEKLKAEVEELKKKLTPPTA